MVFVEMKSVYDLRISHGLLPPARPLTGHPSSQQHHQKRSQLKSAVTRQQPDTALIVPNAQHQKQYAQHVQESYSNLDLYAANHHIQHLPNTDDQHVHHHVHHPNTVDVQMGTIKSSSR